MPSALFLQPNLNPPGGGNGVAAWMLQALRNEYRVRVLSWEEPNVERINTFFGTSLEPTDFESVVMPGLPRRALDAIPMGLGLLKAALLCRWAAQQAADFDVVVTANNEVAVGKRAIQYVHYPRFSFPRPVVDEHWYNRSAALRNAYYGMCLSLGGFGGESFKGNLTLVNSDYIARLTQDLHGIQPVTLYPPACGSFPDTPWEERQDDFVCIGRISREKRVMDALDVLEHVRGKGHEVRLHIVGTNDDSAYYEQVLTRARRAPWVQLHENLTRSELERLVSSCRYGIHGMRGEHFGMVVAELQQAGCLTFAPDDGGCTEILRDPVLTYATTEDAIQKIDRVLSDTGLQEQLRASQAAQRGAFSSDRFCERFLRIVEEFQRAQST